MKQLELEIIEDRLKALEKNSHPCKELHEFDVWPELNARIERLELLVEKLIESGNLK